MAWIGLLKFALLTAGLFALGTALLIGFVYPWIRRWLGRIEPARRARLVAGLLGAPAFVAALQTTLCFLPSVMGLIFPALDHCVSHAHGDHPHLCVVHLPGSAGSLASSLLVGALMAAASVLVGRELARLLRSARSLGALVRTAARGSHEGTLVVESDVPFAAATPLSRRVLLSSRIVEGLPEELLLAVVEHERAHVRRRDPLWRMVGRLLSITHLRWTREALLNDLELASEQACDEEAGRVADRLTVARALVAVERLFASEVSGLGPVPARFGGSNVVARVEALLGPPLPPAHSLLEHHAVTVLVLSSVVLIEPLHHAAEVIVGLLA